MTESEDAEFGRKAVASMQELLSSCGVRGMRPVCISLPLQSRCAIRDALGLTRLAFAQRFGLALTAVRGWQQGLRRPDPAARVLLLAIARGPDVVARAVAESSVACI